MNSGRPLSIGEVFAQAGMWADLEAAVNMPTPA
jgi:hypothetical protein